jgi:hypothetical protein
MDNMPKVTMKPGTNTAKEAQWNSTALKCDADPAQMSSTKGVVNKLGLGAPGKQLK